MSYDFVIHFHWGSSLYYWILSISLTQEYLLLISEMSSYIILAFFFTGIFIGKVMTLYFYGKWSHKTIEKPIQKNINLNRIIGIALIIISTLQGIRFFVSQ